MLRDPLWGSAPHFQSEPRQLCFCLVYAGLGTWSSTRMDPINWKYWTFLVCANQIAKNCFAFDRLLFGSLVNFTAKSPSLQNALGERVRKVSGSSLPPFSFRYWTVRILTFLLPLTAAACKMEGRSMNLDYSTLGYFTEFRQFHFNSGLGYITYVRLYHHAGNDIH